jgi:tight adherence protein C
MENLSQISTVLGLTPQAVFVLLAGGTVFFLGFAIVSIFFGAKNPLRRRLLATAEGKKSLLAENSRPKRDLTGMINPVAKYVLPQDGEERAKITNDLIHAGFRTDKSLPYFYAIKSLLALGLPFVAFLATRWLPEWESGAVMLAMIVAAFIGVTIPNIVLQKIKENRLKKLRNGFPDALDLLVVCVEAGLGLGAAIDRVARDLEVSHAELAEELRLVNVEMRAGVERPAALRNLAERSGLADIRGLVGLLVQTMRFGTSVADALRVYSEEFRDKRMQKAEEQAAKIGTKLIFPLVTCLFPGFFIVAVGPAALRMIVVFGAL